MSRRPGMLRLALLMLLAPAAGAAAADGIAPVRHIDIDVPPYYQSAQTLGGAPDVHVAARFDTQLATSDRKAIVAVRDAIGRDPGDVTPMTLMVLAIRLYDVGLREQSVFWFYVAKDRYLTLNGVLDMHAPELAPVSDATHAFATLAGPVINGYAFCDVERQQKTELAALAWVMAHPSRALFTASLPARDGDRHAHLDDTLSRLRSSIDTERAYLGQPGMLEKLAAMRKARHLDAMYCGP